MKDRILSKKKHEDVIISLVSQFKTIFANSDSP